MWFATIIYNIEAERMQSFFPYNLLKKYITPPLQQQNKQIVSQSGFRVGLIISQSGFSHKVQPR